jgi:hypothetical protein
VAELEKKASQPKVSGKVIRVASTTPQKASWWASQRPRPRARRKVWKPRWPRTERGTAVGRRRKFRQEKNACQPRRKYRRAGGLDTQTA